MTHLILTLVAAGFVAFSAGATYVRAGWVTRSLTDYGVPRSWWPWLAHAKAAGAVGLLAGLVVPFVGVAAGIGLVLYFAGAVVTVVRARWYSHLPFPVLYVMPVVASMVFY
ncbi:hypothetical protein BLA60_37810 [Actinophytocola xinjiangensis]|uniref:DoxX-like protein n=1 Tax=Actinophytocola xinjiangensis TaxID=485602 RepID=A0A7Z0WF38_9PSEU|nr:DoxX family protein [Actinophytocola xinjiangensis]OLF05138.1 hypothetical protein BLA60_37810 [Actinophytocola xinjiangensis]